MCYVLIGLALCGLCGAANLLTNGTFEQDLSIGWTSYMAESRSFSPGIYELTMDRGRLADGVYFVTVSDPNGSFTQKFVLTKQGAI